MTFLLATYARVIHAITITLFFIGLVILLQTEVSLASLQASIHSTGIIGAIIFIVLFSLAATALVPVALLITISALLYPLREALIVSILGSLLGAGISFTMTRWLGKDAMQHIIGKAFTQLQARIEKRSFESVLILRLIPTIPYHMLNYGLGLTTVRKRAYLWATALGLVPIVLVLTLLINHIAALARYEAHYSTFVLPLLLLGLLLGLPFLQRWRMKHKTQIHKKPD